MMTFDFRAKMVDELLKMGWGYSTPSPESIESMRRYYESMTDEQIFEEFQSDTYKAGQDSMTY